MDISKGLEIKDLCLYFVKERILIISDVHMGYEESMNKQGVLLPRFQIEETIERLSAIFNKLNIDTIVINGDLKHEFGIISQTEWKHTLTLLDFFSEHCKNIILIKGNHDEILGPIALKRNLQVKNDFVVGDSVILHGNNIPSKDFFKNFKRIIIGHEHPAISLEKNGRLEKFKCFLKGEWQKKELIVMPSFNLITEGTDLLKEESLSPFLKEVDLNSFEVFIIGDDIYDFGTINDIKKL